MMATAVEAVLGAVHLDGGADALVAVMDRLRIVGPFHESVTFKTPTFEEFCLQIRRDLLTLRCIDPFRQGLKVPFCWNISFLLRV